METVRTSETSVDNHFTRQYNPEDSSKHKNSQSLEELLSCCSCRWGETVSLNCGHHPPGDIWVWRATVEWYWQGKTEELGEKPVPVPLWPPQIPHGMTLGANPGLRCERPATNRLSYGIAWLFVRWDIFCDMEHAITVPWKMSARRIEADPDWGILCIESDMNRNRSEGQQFKLRSCKTELTRDSVVLATV